MFKLSMKLWSYITVLLVAVLLILSVFLGLAAGKEMARAGLIAANAKVLAGGLQYFYSDYDRFPTSLEFQNAELMNNYFNSFPPQKYLSGGCSDNFVYKKLSGNSFQLGFCLPRAAKGYNSGWNVITINQEPAAKASTGF